MDSNDMDVPTASITTPHLPPFPPPPTPASPPVAGPSNVQISPVQWERTPISLAKRTGRPRTGMARNTQTIYQRSRQAELQHRIEVKSARRLQEMKIKKAKIAAAKEAQIQQESREQRDRLLDHISLITIPVQEGGVGMSSLGAAIDALSDIEGSDAQIHATISRTLKSSGPNIVKKNLGE
ncbi:hypothetical protein BT96DRAFT_945944 [Gymnopus androsaceus JB14]|uniref:Uncharacterized protein n=1 Tax=Gymnopus androsaceus JB14 TaxID=1447944 RepID=A0A6A4GXR1_9AGAR|nr:hypothetical protein BT96DRAFT_945944 [Gymnopus androsaceus JB14]